MTIKDELKQYARLGITTLFCALGAITVIALALAWGEFLLAHLGLI